ncbi:MAG TPA: PEGA domain-containing protein, partial [Polyangiaceae bacterium]|nr:PEGA domain-containing protein [Polyangiaceae bacterium]
LPLANIYLDGNKSCEATPCVLRNLEPGTHRLRVEAPGHAPTEQTISVDKGQDRMLAITVNRHAG